MGGNRSVSLGLLFLMLFAAGAASQTTRPAGAPPGTDQPDATSRPAGDSQSQPSASKLREMIAKTLGRPEKAPGPFAEGEPAFTAEQAEAYSKELMPLVEKIAGRKFKASPKVKLVGREELTRVLTRELTPQCKNLMPQLSEEQVRAEAEQSARLFAIVSLGKYGFASDVMYLLPRNLFPWMELAGIDTKHTESVVKLVIAHELTHALQHQHVGLMRKLLAVRSLDEQNALNATIEGHAVLVQEMVGRALKMDEAVTDTARFYSFGRLKIIEDPLLKLIGDIISAFFEDTYLGGKRFVEFQYKKGGTKRVWQILEKPPVASSMIRKPRTYSPVRRKKPDYASMLKGLEKRFGNRKWAVMNLELGDAMLRAAYARFEPDSKKALLDNIEHAQALIARDAPAVAMVNVSLVILKDASFGPKMISIVEEGSRKLLTEMKGSSVNFEGVVFEDLKGIKADAARRMSMKLTSGGSVLIEQVIIRVCRGRAVVELIIQNNPLKDSEIIKIVEEVFDRLSAGTGQAHTRKAA